MSEPTTRRMTRAEREAALMELDELAPSRPTEDREREPQADFDPIATLGFLDHSREPGGIGDWEGGLEP